MSKIHVQEGGKFLHLPVAWFVGKRVRGEAKKFLVTGHGKLPTGEEVVFGGDGSDPGLVLRHKVIEDWEHNTRDGLHELVTGILIPRSRRRRWVPIPLAEYPQVRSRRSRRIKVA